MLQLMSVSLAKTGLGTRQNRGGELRPHKARAPRVSRMTDLLSTWWHSRFAYAES